MERTKSDPLTEFAQEKKRLAHVPDDESPGLPSNNKVMSEFAEIERIQK